MKIDMKDASRLKEILKENGFEKMAHEIDNAIRDSKAHYHKLMTQQLCEHKWEDITKEDVKKMQGFFSEKDTKETILETVFIHCSHCRKCGIRYEDWLQKDLAELANKQNTDAGIFVSFGPETLW